MSHFGTVISWLFKPITVPLAWLFKHRHNLDKDNACKDVYCPFGKEGREGWGTCNGHWVKRKPLPHFVYPGPGPRTEGYSKDLSGNQINAMLQEAYRRTERVRRPVEPKSGIEKLLDAVANNPVPIYIDPKASPHHARLATALEERGLTVLPSRPTMVSLAQHAEYERRVAAAREDEKEDGYYVAPSHSWAFVPPPPELPVPPNAQISCTCFSSNCKHMADPDHVLNRARARQ